MTIGGVSSLFDSFVVAESSFLRTNFCREKPAHQQSIKRCFLKQRFTGMISYLRDDYFIHARQIAFDVFNF
jgi:hypothetical protein